MFSKYKWMSVTVIAGLVGGWTGGSWAMMQPWWPLSVSGRPEQVLTGKLITSPVGSEVGLTVEQGAGRRQFVDASQVPGQLTRRLLGRQVVIRGVAASTGKTDYVLITKLVPGGPLWAK